MISRSFRWTLFTILTGVFLLISGCQTQSTRPTDPSIKVQSWTSADGNQVLLRIPVEERTYYFDNDENRICFRFSFKGMWNPTDERGLLVSSNGKHHVGVLMLSGEDIENYRGNDLLAKVVALHQYGFQRRYNSDPFSSTTDEIEAAPWKAVRWTGKWEVLHEGQKLVAVVNRWLVEVAPGWIAAVTASRGIGGEEAALNIIRSLEVSHESGCYWPKLKPILAAPAPTTLAGPEAKTDKKLEGVSGTYRSEITTRVSNYYFRNKKHRKMIITLEQDGNNIIGTDKATDTKITGTLEGDIIKFKFYSSQVNPGLDIEGEWKISEDRNKLEGSWSGSNNSGSWNLTRIE